MSRGMYRYDVTTLTGRVIVDTGLARPGPLADDGIEGSEMSLDRLGVTDGLAVAWLEALKTAGDTIREGRSLPFVWALGAFHDPDRKVVTLPFTLNGLAGEIQVGPADELALPSGRTGREPRRFDLPAGTLLVPTRPRGVLYGEMAMTDGQHLRLGMLLPTGIPAPELDDLVALIDRTTRTVVR